MALASPSEKQDYSLGPLVETGEHYALLRHVGSLQVAPVGVAVEFGTGSGESARILAERMPVVSFDAFCGLPESWRPGYPRGSFAYMPPNITGVEIVDGWFEDSLPEFDFGALGDIGLCHIDCDLFSSTATALKYAGPYLTSGCSVVFDEIFGYPGHEEHELKAWQEFAEQSNVKWSVVGHGVGGGDPKNIATHEQWAIQIL